MARRTYAHARAYREGYDHLTIFLLQECHLRGRHLDNRTECKNLGGGLDSDTYGESSQREVYTSEYTPYRGRSCGEMSTPDVILAPSGPCTNSGTKRELLVQTAILNQEPDAALDCWR